MKEADPCGMEYIVTTEELLEEVGKQDWDGGMVIVGFRDGSGYHYSTSVADRFSVAGHLMAAAQTLLRDCYDDEEDET